MKPGFLPPEQGDKAPYLRFNFDFDGHNAPGLTALKRNTDRFEIELLDSGDFHPRAELSSTLPSHWYHDAEIHRREHAAIFYRSWWYICHESDVCEAGDRFYGAVADRPVMVGRDRRRGLEAFGIDRGAAPDSEPKPVRLESYAGFLFVNLDPDADALIDQAPGFIEDMYRCCPRLDELLPAERYTREVEVNWKTLVDNNHECYHCEANHRSLMELVDYKNKAIWKDDGITFSHTVERNRLDNSAYALSAESIEQESLFGYIWPNLIPLFFPGTPGLVMFQILPLAPERSLLRHDFFLLHREASRHERQFIDWFRQVLTEEDVRLCENVQRGLHSQGYRQGRFVVDRRHPEYSEHHVHFFQSMVREALLAETTR